LGGVPGFRLVLRLRARFRDTDAMRHVNNAVFFTYFEEARAEYFREVIGLDSYNNVGIILAQTRCDFRSPLYVGEEIDVAARVDRIGRKSVDMSYEIREPRSGRLVAEGTSVQVAFDYAVHRAVDVPEEFRRKATAFEGRPLG
jgi:acyl-CoA thioester hydrolase